MKKKQTTNGQGTLKAKSAEVATPQYEYTSNITIPGVGQSLEDEASSRWPWATRRRC